MKNPVGIVILLVLASGLSYIAGKRSSDNWWKANPEPPLSVYAPPSPAPWQMAIQCTEAAFCFGDTYAVNPAWLVCGVSFDGNIKMAWGNGYSCTDEIAKHEKERNRTKAGQP